jgi:hypothetical protein
LRQGVNGLYHFEMFTSLAVIVSSVFIATPAIPFIDSVAPPSGTIASEVTIHGNGFSSNIEDNQVCFGEIEAHVISASPEQLIVTVPGSIRYAPMFFGGVQVAMRTSDRILQGGGDSRRGGLALSTHA